VRVIEVDVVDGAALRALLDDLRRDAQDLEKAIETYERRFAMGGWEEEVYYSLLQIAVLKERANHPAASVVAAFHRAYEYRPSRAESLVELAAHYRRTQQWPLGEMTARAASAIPPSEDILFVDAAAYAWRALDELAVATYYTRRYKDSAELNRRLLSEGKLPQTERRRVQENLDFSLKKLGQSAPAAPRPSPEPTASATPATAAKEHENARIPFTACPLCGSAHFEEARIGDASHHPLYKPELPARMRWVRCADCGHDFTDGYFSQRALEILFADTNANQKPGADPYGGRAIAAKMVEKVRAALGGVRGRWLDVGFGSGALLGTAAEYGFDVVGLDLRRENVEWMKDSGIEAQALEFTEYRPNARLSVISLADVLEHVPFPKDFLRHAHELLADDGVLFVSMPNADALVWKTAERAGQNPYFGELEHLHNFGRKRLSALLEECGFSVVSYGISERYLMCMELIVTKQHPAR